MIDAKSGFEKGKQTTSRRLIAMLSIGSLILSKEQLRLSNFCFGIGAKKNGPSVETERPLTIACHMKILKNCFCADCYSLVEK